MKKVFAIPILFFISFLIAMYFLAPKYFETRDLKKEVSRKGTELEKKKADLLIFQETLDKLRNHQESFDKVQAGLPSEMSFAFLLNFFQKKAAETGILLKSLSESGLSKNQQQKEQQATIAIPKGKESYFSLYLTGSFPAFEGFLKSLGDSARMIEIEDINIKSIKEQLDFYLTIKVYSY